MIEEIIIDTCVIIVARIVQLQQWSMQMQNLFSLNEVSSNETTIAFSTFILEYIYKKKTQREK
jgi:hypothetical protein